jgi:GntR family transcriptional regulator/MocR family aminotransferase
MTRLMQLELDRSAKMPLAEQIRNGISTAIEDGVLASGARLPSWQDLAGARFGRP